MLFFLIGEISINLNPFGNAVEKIWVEGGDKIWMRASSGDNFIVYASPFDTFNFKRIDKEICISSNEKRFPIYIKIVPAKILPPKIYNLRIKIWGRGEVRVYKECEKSMGERKGDNKITLHLENIIRGGERIEMDGRIYLDSTYSSVKIDINTPLEVISFKLDNVEYEIRDGFVEIERIEEGSHDFTLTLYAPPFQEAKDVQVFLLLYSEERLICSLRKYIRYIGDFYQRYGVVCGRVKTPKGKGIKGVEVWLDEGRKTLTDKDGKFFFQKVFPGHHVLYVRGRKVSFELPEGGMYSTQIIMEEKKVFPQREIVLLYLGNVDISGVGREEMRIEGEGRFFLVGEITKDVAVKLILNSEGRDSRFEYPEHAKYYVVQQGEGEEGMFYLMIEKKGEGKIEGGLLGRDDRKFLGGRIEKTLGRYASIKGETGFPEGILIRESFPSREGEYHLLHPPVVPYSERIFLIRKGVMEEDIEKVILKKENYEMDYEKGILYVKIVPIDYDSMIVEYYSKKIEAEGIYGRVEADIKIPHSSTRLWIEKEASTKKCRFTGIEQDIWWRYFRISGEYATRIEDVEGRDRYRVSLSFRTPYFSLKGTHKKIGRNSQIPVPGYTGKEIQEDRIDIDLRTGIPGPFLSPKFFYQTEDGMVRRGWEVDGGWWIFRETGFSVKYRISKGNEKVRLIGFSFISPWIRFSPYLAKQIDDTWKKKGVNLSISYTPILTLKFRGEKIEEKISSIHAVPGVYFSLPHIPFSSNLFLDYLRRGQEATIKYGGGMNIELPSLQMSVDITKTRDGFHSIGRGILEFSPWIRLFIRETMERNSVKLVEGGIAFMPNFRENIVFIGALRKIRDEISFCTNSFFSISRYVECMYTGIKSFHTDFHHLRMTIPIFKEVVKVYGEGCLISTPKKRDIVGGGGLLLDIGPFGIAFGYNRIGTSSIKRGIGVGIFTKGIYHWVYGIERSALEVLSEIKIKTPFVVYVDKPFEVLIYLLDRNKELIKDFVGEILLTTDGTKKKIRVREKNRGKIKVKLRVKKRGLHYILVEDKKGRVWKEFFWAIRPGEKIEYREPEPYLERRERLEKLEVEVPTYAEPGVPFTITIKAISNLGRIFKDYEGEIRIKTSNRTDVSPMVVRFTKKDKGIKRVKLVYPEEDRIRLILRDMREKNKVAISRYITFRKKKIVRKIRPKKEVPSVKKLTKEEIDALIKEGLKYFTKGEYEKAKEIWLKILKSDPGNERVKKYLKSTEKRLKR